jgi:hypothetical protein
VLASSAEESPVKPLRLWLFHVALVCSDTRRGPTRARGSASDVESAADAADSGVDSSDSEREEEQVRHG